MAISGVEPATYIMPNDHDYFTNEQVREILINFANSKNAMRRDMTAERIVDEFMESGE